MREKDKVWDKDTVWDGQYKLMRVLIPHVADGLPGAAVGTSKPKNPLTPPF